MQIMRCYGIHIIKGGFIISLAPTCLKPYVSFQIQMIIIWLSTEHSLVARAIFNTEGKIREVEDYLRPIIAERLEDDLNLRSDDDAVGCIHYETDGICS